jgi:hypothetical protein
MIRLKNKIACFNLYEPWKHIKPKLGIFFHLLNLKFHQYHDKKNFNFNFQFNGTRLILNKVCQMFYQKMWEFLLI